VSHYCISHATCPVVTVPALLDDPPNERSSDNGHRLEGVAS
jgi:hypothetical protein